MRPVAVILAALIPPALAAPRLAPALQTASAYAPAPAAPGQIVTVTAGERYAAGSLHRALFGAHYRELWTAPVQVSLLDLESYAGGLTPEELGGGQQTRSLKLESADGREFAFRPVDKDPSGALPEPYRGTVVDRLAQDAVSAANPAAPIIAAALLEAAGILNARPHLLVMADQERLGEFREEFAGKLGYLEERPAEGFAGADEVLEWEELLELLAEDPSHRVDAAEFLRARLVDHLLGDWDRHRDQWRWAGFTRQDGMLWRPIPRDRDQALVRYDGLLLSLARRVHPKLVNFSPRYPSVLALAWNAQQLDRRLLAVLDRDQFDTAARAIQAALTDSVIDAALDQVPAGYRRPLHPWLAAALRQRRDSLPAHATALYRMLAEEVDVAGTDQADLAEAHRDAGGLLRLVVTSAGGADTLIYRTFLPGETRSVRLLLGGGPDTIRLTGSGGTGPLLEIEREPGVDSVIVEPDAGGVRLYGPAPKMDLVKADSTAADQPDRDWGGSLGAGPRIEYDPDLGLLLGAQVTRTDYAFRRTPYGSRVRLATQYATAARGLRTELIADVKRVNPRLRLELGARASEIEVVRFAGFGNETTARDGSSLREVDHWLLAVSAMVEYAALEGIRIHAGPLMKYGTTDLEGEHLVGRLRPLGSEGFGRVGVQAGLTATTSDTSALDEALAAVSVAGTLYPPLWSASTAFGMLEVGVSGRAPVTLGPPAVLAGRIGAKRIWGPFPYDEAAFLGGQSTLRGYEYQRFAGNAMLFAGAELRVPVARVLRRSVPTTIGVFALADAGRVWADGDRSRRVHAAGGGGVWLSFFEERNTVSVAAASGAEGTRWYVRAGMGL